jgi:hypothetical protein
MDEFIKLLSSLFNNQSMNFVQAWNQNIGNRNLKAIFENIEVDDATRAKAQELISEDGYFGVKQTSERILGFARAYAGSDPAAIDKMESFFERAFKQAEQAWGGKLPDISYATRDAVRAGFEEMRNGTAQEASAT